MFYIQGKILRPGPNSDVADIPGYIKNICGTTNLQAEYLCLHKKFYCLTLQGIPIHPKINNHQFWIIYIITDWKDGSFFVLLYFIRRDNQPVNSSKGNIVCSFIVKSYFCHRAFTDKQSGLLNAYKGCIGKKSLFGKSFLCRTFNTISKKPKAEKKREQKGQ